MFSGGSTTSLLLGFTSCSLGIGTNLGIKLPSLEGGLRQFAVALSLARTEREGGAAPDLDQREPRVAPAFESAGIPALKLAGVKKT
jgi:hypothetical protein